MFRAVFNVDSDDKRKQRLPSLISYSASQSEKHDYAAMVIFEYVLINSCNGEDLVRECPRWPYLRNCITCDSSSFMIFKFYFCTSYNQTCILHPVTFQYEAYGGKMWFLRYFKESHVYCALTSLTLSSADVCASFTVGRARPRFCTEDFDVHSTRIPDFGVSYFTKWVILWYILFNYFSMPHK